MDWSGLMPKHPKEPREPGAALLKFTPGAVMLRVGVSKKLAGSELFTRVRETCQRLLEKPKGDGALLGRVPCAVAAEMPVSRALLPPPVARAVWGLCF